MKKLRLQELIEELIQLCKQRNLQFHESSLIVILEPLGLIRQFEATSLSNDPQ